MRRFTIVFLIAMMLIGHTSFAFMVMTDTSVENFEALSGQLSTAVEARDFHQAREVINELLPMMKENIKASKKTLSQLKKADDPEISYKEYKEVVSRKIELQETIEHFVDMSAAALRVKSNLIVQDVNEFIKLMEQDPSET